jgi:4-hydroxybenzoate polyprenyltransferase
VKLATLLQLGRVSNLPTVWSNVLAAHALTLMASDDASVRWAPLCCCLVAGTLLYEGGMLLNDAYDADVDRVERPERPIPSGRASRDAVSAIGFSLLALGVLVPIAFASYGTTGQGTIAAAATTAVCVWAYDRFHKGISWAPLLMGACRAGVYGMATFAVSDSPPLRVAISGAALLLYVVGLTHVARFETGSRVQRAWLLVSLFAPALSLPWVGASSALGWLPFLALQLAWIGFSLRVLHRGGRGSIGRTVVSLIAGISLVDATYVATTGQWLLALLAVLAYVTTLSLQQWVSGT